MYNFPLLLSQFAFDPPGHWTGHRQIEKGKYESEMTGNGLGGVECGREASTVIQGERD